GCPYSDVARTIIYVRPVSYPFATFGTPYVRISRIHRDSGICERFRADHVVMIRIRELRRYYRQGYPKLGQFPLQQPVLAKDISHHDQTVLGRPWPAMARSWR